MTTASDAPVLDTITAMTIDSIERCHMDQRSLVLSALPLSWPWTHRRSPTWPTSTPR